MKFTDPYTTLITYGKDLLALEEAVTLKVRQRSGAEGQDITARDAAIADGVKSVFAAMKLYTDELHRCAKLPGGVRAMVNRPDLQKLQNKLDVAQDKRDRAIALYASKNKGPADE
jgi:hypothetical protein